MSKFQPMNDWITVVPDEASEKTIGGIYIPDGSEAPDSTGVVVGRGVGKKKSDGDIDLTFVDVGDHVLFGRGIDYEIEVDGERQLIMKETNVLAIRRDV